MKKITRLKFGFLMFNVIVSLALFSCGTTKNIKYFNDLTDSAKYSTKALAQYSDPIIAPDDILSINIQTLNPGNPLAGSEQGAVMSGTSSATTNSAGQQISGFLVDKNGEIEISLLGKIKVAGLTTSGARDLIGSRVAVYFKDPAVQVRYANFKVTLMGEVTRPSSYIMPNEKVSILDAIGMAGDLTIYGKRENVLLIRNNGDKKEFVRFNLNSTDIFQSPYFYLRQNDVIYVEPNSAKIATTDAYKNRTFTILASLSSAVLVLLIRFIK